MRYYVRNESESMSASSKGPLPQALSAHVTLGSVNELVTSSNANSTMKVKCYLHSKCNLFVRTAKLPANPDAKAREWLLHGYRKYPQRGQGSEHMKDAVMFFPER